MEHNGDAQKHGENDALDNGTLSNGTNDIAWEEIGKGFLPARLCRLDIRSGVEHERAVGKSSTGVEYHAEQHTEYGRQERRQQEQQDCLKTDVRKLSKRQRTDGFDDQAHHKRYDTHLDKPKENISDKFNICHNGAKYDARDDTGNRSDSHGRCRVIGKLAFCLLGHNSPLFS